MRLCHILSGIKLFYQTYQIKSGQSGSSVALPIAKLLTWMQFVSDYSFTVNNLPKRIFTIVVAILFRSTFCVTLYHLCISHSGHMHNNTIAMCCSRRSQIFGEILSLPSSCSWIFIDRLPRIFLELSQIFWSHYYNLSTWIISFTQC